DCTLNTAKFTDSHNSFDVRLGIPWCSSFFRGDKSADLAGEVQNFVRLFFFQVRLDKSTQECIPGADRVLNLHDVAWMIKQLSFLIDQSAPGSSGDADDLHRIMLVQIEAE